MSHIDNGNGHTVFKLNTKAVVSVNMVVVIPTPQIFIDQVDQMGASEKQSEGIQFTNMDERVTIHDLHLNRADNDDDDSNTSGKNFHHDEEYKKEFDNNKNGDEDLATLGSKFEFWGCPILEQWNHSN